MRVDCTPPDVSVDRAAAEVQAGEVVEPVVVAGDATSGLHAVEVEVSVDGAPWADAPDGMVAEDGRRYVFRARAVDVAGNWSAWVAAPPVEGVAGTEPPAEEGPTVDVPPAAEEPVAQVPAPVELLGGEETRPTTVAPAEVAPGGGVPTERLPSVAIDPRLRITRVLARRRGQVEVAGTAAPGLVTRASVEVKAGRRSIRRTAAISAGRWRARFRTKRTARATEVRVTTPATGDFAPGTARWRR